LGVDTSPIGGDYAHNSQEYPVKSGAGVPTFSRDDLWRNMFLLAAAGVAFISVVLTGGRVHRLLALKIRAAWLLMVALAIQILVISVFPDADRSLLAIMHVASYALAGVVVVLNRAIRGLPTIGFGGLLNAIAIVANGGTMPASSGALATAGLTNATGTFENSAALAAPNLSFLGDIFAIPASWPFHNVFSLGDILIVLGAALLLHFGCGSRVAQSPSADRLFGWC
jgi:hypothetical protein